MLKKIFCFFSITFMSACIHYKTSTPITTSIHTLQFKIHQQVNKIRVEHGLKPLSLNSSLNKIAANHSADMENRQYFEHYSPEGRDFSFRYKAAGYDCKAPVEDNIFYTGGENLFKGYRSAAYKIWGDGSREEIDLYSMDELAEHVVDQWMNSPSHKKNLLIPYWLSEGIGISVANDGLVYVTQNFC